jgi:hypothetical protein
MDEKALSNNLRRLRRFLDRSELANYDPLNSDFRDQVAWDAEQEKNVAGCENH